MSVAHWINNKIGWFFTNGNKTNQYTENATLTDEDVKTVKEALFHATEFKLEVEVISYALKYMKENPSLTVGEAITLGYFEWVK